MYFTRLIFPNPLNNGFCKPYFPVSFPAAEPAAVLQYEKRDLAKLGINRLLTGFLWLGGTDLDFPADPFLHGGLGQCHFHRQL